MLVVASVMSLTAFCSIARADGDPASDVLAEQTVFIPAGRGIPAPAQARLAAVVRSASEHGVPVRVALIASRSDLGAVTQLWHRPAQYARFLGTELGVVFSGTLIVVMPNGYGVWIVGRHATRVALARAGSSLIGAPLAESGRATASAAVIAVRRLAAAAGRPLPNPRISTVDTGRASSPTGPVAWSVLAVGALLVMAAWVASLRARPWRRSDDASAPSPGV